VRDTAALLDLVAGAMPGDPYAAPPPARPFAREVGADPGCLRVGFMEVAPRAGELHPECRSAVRGAARLLESCGHRLEAGYPRALDDPEAVGAFVAIVAAGVATAVDAWGRKLGRPLAEGEVEPLTWAIVTQARARSAPDYVAALARQHAHGRALAGWWESGFDLLLTPTCAAPPPELGQVVGDDPANPLAGYLRAAPFGAFTLHFNMSGQPAISLPLHWSADGLPVGVQLVAASGREDLLLRVAAQLEAAAPWADRIPPVHASRLR
jgi:amidase